MTILGDIVFKAMRFELLDAQMVLCAVQAEQILTRRKIKTDLLGYAAIAVRTGLTHLKAAYLRNNSSQTIFVFDST